MRNYRGSDLSQAFKDFYRKEKARIIKNLKKLECDNIVMSMQFNYFYGFFTSKSGQKYYFSCPDVRHFGYDNLLYRKVKDYCDYRGETNHYIGVKDLNKLNIE